MSARLNNINIRYISNFQFKSISELKIQRDAHPQKITIFVDDLN